MAINQLEATFTTIGMCRPTIHAAGTHASTYGSDLSKPVGEPVSAIAAPDQMPNPTQWTFTKTSWFSERTITASEGNFLLPIPNAELSQAPNLQKDPVDYP